MQFDDYNLYRVIKLLSGPDSEKAEPFKGLLGAGSLSLSGQGLDKNSIEGSGVLEIRRAARPPTGLTAPVGHGEKIKPSPNEIEGWRRISQAIVAAKPLRLFSMVSQGKLVWTKSKEGFQIHQGLLSFPEGKASISGRFQKETGLSFNTWISTDEIKTAADLLQIPVTGQFYMAGTVSGSLQKPSFAGQIKLNHWTLKQRPFGAFQTELLYQDKTLTFQDGLLEGVRHAGFLGADPLYQINGTFRVPDPGKPPVYHFLTNARSVDPQEMMALFIKGIPLSTTVSGEVVIKGIGKQISISGPLTLGEGSLYGENFSKGRLLMHVTEKSVTLRHILLEREEMTAEGEGEISYEGAYTLEAKGSLLLLEEMAFMAKLKPDLSGKADLTINGKGTLKAPILKMFAAIQNLKYKEIPMGSGTIQANWQDKEITFLSAFPQKKFSLRATMGSEKPYPVLFQTHFTTLPIHALFQKQQDSESVLSKISSYADGELSGQGELESPKQINLKGSLSLLSAQWGDYLLVNDGPVTFFAEKGNVQIEHAAFKGANTDLTLSGRVAPFYDWGLVVKGEADINLLRLFTPKVRSADGVAKMDIRISDQWDNPKIAGVLSLESGRVALSDFADSIFISTLSLVFNKQILILETVSGKMGRGQFAGFGKADLSKFVLTRFGFQFDLKKMPIRFARNIESVIEGKLLFQGDRTTQSLEGSLHIEKALYEKRVNILEMLAKWRENQEERIPVHVPFAGTTRLSIHLSGKDNISVRNNVAKVPLEVDLFLKGTLERPLLFGQVDIPKGTFAFRANEFKVTSGAIQFVNPEKIDPMFDIKGRSRVRDYTVELSLMGTLSKFFMDLISFPPLPNADILSLLAFGKTTTELLASGTGEGNIMSSVVSDVLSGFLSDPVGELIRLDKVTIGTPSGKSSKNTLLTVEKKVLNDRLLVIYSTAFDPTEEPKLQMGYDLGKHLSIVLERDEKGQMGGDLRFRFEFK